MKTAQYDFPSSEDERVERMHAEAEARVAVPGYDPEFEHHKAIADRVARCSALNKRYPEIGIRPVLKERANVVAAESEAA